MQLVLDNVHITNADFPCIYVVSGDKIFLTSASDSSFSVTGSFRTDNGIKTDSAVFSRQDLVLNGTASVTVSSTGSGVVSKDDLKITGGTWNVTADSAALKANDSVRIAGGTLSLTAGTDAIHAENNDDDVKGYIFISGGDITVKAGDDGIHAVSVLQIDGGVFDITAGEGLEATVVQFNGGTAGIVSSGDAVSAGSKSSSFTPAVVFNGGRSPLTSRGRTTLTAWIPKAASISTAERSILPAAAHMTAKEKWNITAEPLPSTAVNFRDPGEDPQPDIKYLINHNAW